MLSNSLNIKKQTENMIDSYAIHDTVTFTSSLGSVLRSVLDFDSYTTLSGSLDEETPNTVEEFMGFTKSHKKGETPKWERQAILDAKIEKARAKIESMPAGNFPDWDKQSNKQAFRIKKNIPDAKRQSPANSKHPFVSLEEDYEWGVRDYILSPFGFIVGALGALPKDTKGPDCALNTNNFRSFIIKGFEIGDQEQEEDGVETHFLAAESYHTAGSYLDEFGVFCQQSVTSTLSATYWTNLFSNWYIDIPVNLLYNAGFMWVDAINFIYYTPDTLEDGDWGYFASYLAGDFGIRIFYHDDTPQRVQV